MNPIDRVKPKVSDSDVLCSGCWKVRAKNSAIGWIFIKFNYLDPAVLCPQCRDKFGPDFEKMLKAGL